VLASAIALTLFFAPPEETPPPETEAAGDVAEEGEGEGEAPEAPVIQPPGTLVLAPETPGEYRLFDAQGVAVGEPVVLAEGEQRELQLPPGIYSVHGPDVVSPVAVASGVSLAWDGEDLLPPETLAARRALQAAEAAAAAEEAQRLAEAEQKAAADQAAQGSARSHSRNWRRWASPLSSTFIPGFGQFLNGQPGKGAGILFGTISSVVGAVALYGLPNDGTRGLGAEYARLVGYGVFSTAAPLLWVYGIADAYRVATGKEIEPQLEHKVRLSVTRMMTVGFRADASRPGFYDDWSVSILGQATRRLSLGLSDLSIKPGGVDGPQVWQFGARIDYRVFDRGRVWIDLALGSVLQVAVGQNPSSLDPNLGTAGTTTKFGAVPYGQLDVRIFVLDRLSFDLVPRLAVPVTTRYYSVSRALPRYAPQLELGAGLSTYF
jgi:TM2 domain-containing membrane protein YozV